MVAYTGNPVIRKTNPMRDRSMRRPQHSWLVNARPYRLTPIALAPVMAGDTLKSASYQSRAITDPLKSSLSGWHLEYWWFYCRIMDMDDGASILAKLISEDAGAFAPETAVAALHHAYGVNWMDRILKLVTPHYFRDYGEAWDSVMESSLPVLAVRGRHWFDQYVADGSLPADDEDAEDFENLWSKWTVLSRNRLTTQTYEEFLMGQGIKPPKNLREPDADLRIPELVRFYRDFQYPVSTINAATGAASNAVSWSVQDRLDRSRRFAEPGFLVGFTCARAKAYLPTVVGTGPTATSIWQAGSAAGALNTAKSWIPPVYANEPGESLREFAEGTGPLGNALADDYWIDHRNLFLDGDQFIYGTPGDGQTVPRRAAPHWRYPTEAGLTAQFAADTATLVRQEGMISFQLASRVKRTTR